MKQLSLLLSLLLILSCKKQPVLLDTIRQKTIINAFGPPRLNESFGKNKFRIGDHVFERGLGVHAPSSLKIALNGKATRFTATIGVDREVTRLFDPDSMKSVVYFPHYVYGIYGDKNFEALKFKQGATVRFLVYLDDSLAYDSDIMSYETPAKKVEIDLSGKKILRLEVADAGDGCNLDHADWADATIDYQGSPDELVMDYYPAQIALNHIGYRPGASKICSVSGTDADSFSLMDVDLTKDVFKDKLTRTVDDFGTFLTGDFSSVKREGRYVVKAGSVISDTFSISDTVYLRAIRASLAYHTKQRCGHPDGWHGACHLDDGVDEKTGKHVDMTGGWHDACDLRKMSYDITMFNGLCHFGSKVKDDGLRKRIFEEICWGNKFYLKMQSAEGYYMDRFGHQKNDNCFTDNIPGNSDDRKLYSEPADMFYQVCFLMAQTSCARFSSSFDRIYSDLCTQSAERCYRWIHAGKKPLITSANIAAMMVACHDLFILTKKESYQKDMTVMLDSLLSMQNGDNDIPSGFFYSAKGAPEPLRDIFKGNYYLENLAALYNESTDQKIKDKCFTALDRYCHNYLLPMIKKTHYGIVPVGLYASDPGGSRKAGKYFYRWFWENNERQDIWWNGTNPHILASGAGMAQAAVILKDPELMIAAQHQLDWVFGHNPFNSSSFTGLGYHQPPLFKTGEFAPVTPDLNGGGMAGIGSEMNDIPVLCPGWWNTCEYWGPVNSNFLWLLAELQY